MEPFREVRSPERNYGPARLPGGDGRTPLARRLAGEAGIDLAKIKGSGPHGRIVAADIEQARSTKPPRLRPGAAAVGADRSDRRYRDRGSALVVRDADTLSLADVIVKAWAMSLRRAMPNAPADIALAAGKAPALIARCRGPLAHRDRGGATREKRGRATRRDRDLHRRSGRHRIRRARRSSAADHDAEPRFAPPRAGRGAGRLGRVRRHRDRDAGVRSARGRCGARRRAAFNLQGICRTACDNAGVSASFTRSAARRSLRRTGAPARDRA